MATNQSLKDLPKEVKHLISVFLIVLSIGYFTGITFVEDTTDQSPTGIEQNYLGNEDDDAAVEMKFKKSKQEILNIVHTHILSISVIFFLTGLLVSKTSVNSMLRKLLMIEPFVSILLTFGGIYLLWSGILWMKYVIMVSGIAMTLAFMGALIVIFQSLYFSK
ncbi:hypothetical protein [Psychroflexus montanilacus]|uniref:hypothetical protein n=1 Tax=Psychroflexus montanilacus TaxID=2873598 RepID=UPI001CCB760C|nr:hypothetical protein [Psychroflexus montanilacus]MBZ9651862.1 hypothetical protein [Psychroflexus montanilacus]